MHPGNYNKSLLSNSGLVELTIRNIPLLSGSYYLSVFLGDSFGDYNMIDSVISFDFITTEVENSKVPHQNFVGSVNLKNAQWMHYSSYSE
jgi:lipopolysaccharide transport system ATP-binding protein